MSSRIINVGNIPIGGGSPIVIQTMWKDRLLPCGLEDAAKRVEFLKSMGCALLRFAAPDIETAETLGRLAEMVSMPLAADIHFDYKIALRCMDFPIAKIRINPGNIGGRDKVKAVLEKAGERGIPLRIGVNAGSLPKDLQEEYSTAEALVLAAQREIAFFDEFGFTDYLVSMKASGIADTIVANKILFERLDAPLHIGVTEAGPLISGVAKSTAALLMLLAAGIGDTVRVSLSDTMESEVIAAREIIAVAAQMSPQNERLKRRGAGIISCPRCGRHGFDTHGFTNRWLPRLYALDKENVTVAIMGCEVNGPGEAKNADLGITGTGDKVLIFKHGQIIKTINAKEADAAFEEELNNL